MALPSQACKAGESACGSRRDRFSLALMRQVNLAHVDLDTKAGPFGNGDEPVDDLERFFRQPLAGYRDHVHLRDHRRAHRRKRDFTLLEQLLLPPADPLASDNCTSRR
jgi:hypothetical protein